MTWFAVGGAVIGAAGSIIGGGSAARGQQKAADNATQLQRDQYWQTRTDNMPALDARNNALASMQDLAGKYGGGVPSAQAVMGQPGYQFGLQQGNANIQNNAAAQGGLYSGAVGKALAKYGTDYATSKYNDAFNQMQTAQTNDFNRYASISGQGQTGANQIANAGQNYANTSGAYGMQNGNNQAEATVGMTNAGLNGLNQGISAWNNRSTIPSSGGSWFSGGAAGNPNPTYDYGAPSYMDNTANMPRQPYADGGPVRSEPKIGSRSPVRGGTGGGLNDLSAMLDIPPQYSGVGGLAANPATKPKAIIEDRLKKAGEYAFGGPVKGPGGPRADVIPARLSNGEHVIDAASVTALGGGSNEAGQQKLNKLRAMLKKGR